MGLTVAIYLMVSCLIPSFLVFGAIYVLQWRGWGGVYGSAQISVTNVYGPMLLALRDGG